LKSQLTLKYTNKPLALTSGAFGSFLMASYCVTYTYKIKYILSR
jgi:hypothetical protein